jgi:hypothetical protein
MLSVDLGGADTAAGLQRALRQVAMPLGLGALVRRTAQRQDFVERSVANMVARGNGREPTYK